MRPDLTPKKLGDHVMVWDSLQYPQPDRAPPTPWQPIMVGDLVEKALTTIGITQERVEKLTRTAGKPGWCGCAGRKKWLNEKGVEVQKAIRDTAKKVYGVG